MRLEEMMRLQLAGHGISLDSPKPTFVKPRAPAPPTIDRKRIAEILSPKVPARSLRWLTDSCPSVHDAETFQMPRFST